MLPKRMGPALTLAAVMAIAGFSATTTAQAGGYGYGSGGSWNDHQTYTPKRHRVQRQVYNGSNQHLLWCFNQYRSFRRSDNTFQPYHGPRKECLSPYVEERLELFAGRRNEAPEVLFQNQAGGTIQQGGTDQFGNQPEVIENGTVQGNGNADQSDAFGNLPEQVSAVSGETAPADPEQPSVAASAPDEPVSTGSGTTDQAPARADNAANDAESEPAPSVAGDGAQDSAEPAGTAGSQAGEEASAGATLPVSASEAEPAVQAEADKGGVEEVQ